MDKPQDFPRLDALQSDAPKIALRAVSIGTVASLCVFGALGVLGRREARSAVAPINATSHVLYGDRAGVVEDIDISHTGVGSVINHGASIFWALPFTWWLSQTRNRSASRIALAAATTATVAGAVDYGLVPRRLSPGWEHAVPPRSVAMTFGSLAVGLALGALVTRRLDRG
ncbi:hypothetical protein [Marivita sp.]|uniref:hypothetical protein n=1 Tax=Marivita sp. TaxID=2003365 RepID=UPI0025C26842|nr:hypothetical protein [Marivita sp.]